MIKISTTRKSKGIVVSKTITIDLDLLNAVRDEIEIMGKTFSDGTTSLLKLAIDIRRLRRTEEERALSEEERQLLIGARK